MKMNQEKPEKLEKPTGHAREAPHSHLIQGLSPVIFTIILGLDGWVLHWTTQLNDVVPFVVRGILCVVFLILAVYLMNSSHKILFKDHKPSDTLITEGILNRVRNPMYLGIMCIYLAFFFLSMSLIALGAFIFIVIVYDKMVQYEEGILEQLFGEAFVEYKNQVPRWFPKLF